MGSGEEQANATKANCLKDSWDSSISPAQLSDRETVNALEAHNLQVVRETTSSQQPSNVEIIDPFAATFPTALIAPVVEEEWQEEWDTFQDPEAEDGQTRVG